jgi:hypothetical protein
MARIEKAGGLFNDAAARGRRVALSHMGRESPARKAVF